MMKLKNYFYTILSVAFLATSFASCSDDDDPVYSSENQITSFKVGDKEGTIDQTKRTIEILLDKTVDLTKVKPVIVASKFAEVTPNSETEVDLSEAFIYSVKAQNGEMVQYTVVASHIKSSDAIVTKFTFEGFKAVGDIDEVNKTISITLPKGTDVTKLTPEVAFAGVKCSLEKKVADFSQPVKFTITAEDGKTAEYTVTVSIEKSKVAKVTAFSFKGVKAEGIIDEAKKTITVEVPVGTDVTKLVPVLVIDEDGTANFDGDKAIDFSTPQELIITAQDGKTTTTYIVTIKKPISELILNTWNLEDYIASGKVNNAAVQEAILKEINSGITVVDIPFIGKLPIPIKTLLQGIDISFEKGGIFTIQAATDKISTDPNPKPIVAKGVYTMKNGVMSINALTSMDLGSLDDILQEMSVELAPEDIVDLVNGLLVEPFVINISEVQENKNFTAEVDITKFYGTDKIATIIESAGIKDVQAKDVKVESLTVKITCNVASDKK